MQTENHKIVISINVTPEQLQATDDLYEVVAPELKKDEVLLSKFATFFASKLSGLDLVEQFAKQVLQPKVAQLANELDHRLTLPLYAALAKHISNEWVQEAVGNGPDADFGTEASLSAKLVPGLGSYVESENLQQVPKLHPAAAWPFPPTDNKERVVGANPALAAPYTGNSVVQGTAADAIAAAPTSTLVGLCLGAAPTLDIDTHEAQTYHPLSFTPPAAISNDPTEDALTYAAPRPVLARGSAGQDRSKPVLTSKVLRGFQALEDKLMLNKHGHSQVLPELTHGSPDIRTALLYIARMTEWADKQGKL